MYICSAIHNIRGRLRSIINGRLFLCLLSTAYNNMQRLTLWGKLMLPRLPRVCIAAGSGRCFSVL